MRVLLDFLNAAFGEGTAFALAVLAGLACAGLLLWWRLEAFVTRTRWWPPGEMEL